MFSPSCVGCYGYGDQGGRGGLGGSLFGLALVLLLLRASIVFNCVMFSSHSKIMKNLLGNWMGMRHSRLPTNQKLHWFGSYCKCKARWTQIKKIKRIFSTLPLLPTSFTLDPLCWSNPILMPSKTWMPVLPWCNKSCPSFFSLSLSSHKMNGLPVKNGFVLY